MCSLREFQIVLAEGFAISGAEQGDPTGQPILLIHGYGDSWRSFLPLLGELPPTIRTICISLRGHGDSSRPRQGYDTSHFAGDVIATMDCLEIESAVVVGHSMGSLVAQRLAVEYPGRIQSLILIGAFATLRNNATVDALWRDHVATMRDPVDPEFVRAFQQSSLARSVQATFFEDVVAQSLKVPARVWRSALRAMLDEDRSSRLREVIAPTLIVWGDRDALTNRMEQETLANTIPLARLAIHTGAGHAPHWEDPTRVARELAGHLAGHTR